jgi:hypothetical protein
MRWRARRFASLPTLRLLLALIFIGAVVIAPLDKVCAQIPPIMAIKPQLSAPFNPMLPTKNVFVISPTPNENQRRVSNWVPTPVNQSLDARHIYKSTQFDCLRTNKKFNWRISVAVVEHQIATRAAPIDSNSHIFSLCLASVPPLRCDSKTSDVETRVRLIFLRQILNINHLGICGSSQFRTKPIKENERTPCVTEVSFLDFPQGSSGTIKSECEPSDNESSESRKKSVVMVNSANYAKRATSDEFGDDEVLLIWLCLSLVGCPIIYALVKCGGEFFFGPYK